MYRAFLLLFIITNKCTMLHIRLNMYLYAATNTYSLHERV